MRWLAGPDVIIVVAQTGVIGQRVGIDVKGENISRNLCREIAVLINQRTIINPGT